MTLSADIHKQQLRQHYLSLRSSIHPQQAKEAAAQLAQHVLALVGRDAKIVAAYCAIHAEMDMQPACQLLAEAGHALCLPVMARPAEPLVFRHWEYGQPLVSGRHGIQVPPEDEHEVTPDIVLIPLVAFDETGHRLGYGAGYYDRTIAALHAASKRPLCIGVGYALQQAATLPAQAHDEQLDAVITEAGITRFT